MGDRPPPFSRRTTWCRQLTSRRGGLILPEVWLSVRLDPELGHDQISAFGPGWAMDSFDPYYKWLGILRWRTADSNTCTKNAKPATRRRRRRMFRSLATKPWNCPAIPRTGHLRRTGTRQCRHLPLLLNRKRGCVRHHPGLSSWTREHSRRRSLVPVANGRMRQGQLLRRVSLRGCSGRQWPFSPLVGYLPFVVS